MIFFDVKHPSTIPPFAVLENNPTIKGNQLVQKKNLGSLGLRDQSSNSELFCQNLKASIPECLPRCWARASLCCEDDDDAEDYGNADDDDYDCFSITHATMQLNAT